MLLVLDDGAQLAQQPGAQLDQVLKLVEDDDESLLFPGFRDQFRLLEELFQKGVKVGAPGAGRFEGDLGVAVVVDRQRRPDPDGLEMLDHPFFGALRRRPEGVEICRGEPIGEPGARGNEHAIEVGDRDAIRLQPSSHLEDQRGLAEAARRLDQDVLPIAQLALQDENVGFSIGERIAGDDPAEAKRVAG